MDGQASNDQDHPAGNQYFPKRAHVIKMVNPVKKGKLYLIPSPIAKDGHNNTAPPQVIESIRHIQHFLVEDIRTARRFLSSLKIFESIESLRFSKLDKNTNASELDSMMQPLLDGLDVGVLSEAGCPGIADPGSLAVQYAHEQQFQVVPLVGPSSIILALMASGLNGQQFAFHGYLPIDTKEFDTRIQRLEQESSRRKQTQMFIETPYRNQQLAERLFRRLDPSTRLCIALDLTGPDEMVKTQRIEAWRAHGISLPKLPCLFLFLAN